MGVGYAQGFGIQQPHPIELKLSTASDLNARARSLQPARERVPYSQAPEIIARAVRARAPRLVQIFAGRRPPIA